MPAKNPRFPGVIGSTIRVMVTEHFQCRLSGARVNEFHCVDRRYAQGVFAAGLCCCYTPQL